MALPDENCCVITSAEGTATTKSNPAHARPPVIRRSIANFLTWHFTQKRNATGIHSPARIAGSYNS
jgi:hypothetical protein